MGFLTTVTIYNDGMDQLDGNEKEFVDGITNNLNRGGEFGLGNHLNLVTVFKSVHADTPTIYVNHGNSVVNVDAYDTQFVDLVRNHPEIAAKYVGIARSVVENAEKLIKSEKK